MNCALKFVGRFYSVIFLNRTVHLCHFKNLLIQNIFLQTHARASFDWTKSSSTLAIAATDRRFDSSIASGTSWIKCQYSKCTYRTLRHDHMTYHTRIHTGEKPYTCPHCPYKASQQSCLNLHVKVVHLKLKPYTCQYCSYKCSRKWQLKLHLFNKHSK